MWREGRWHLPLLLAPQLVPFRHPEKLGEADDYESTQEQVRRRARDSLDRSQRRGCLSSGLRVLACLTTAERLVPTSRASKIQKQGKEMKEQEAS